MPIPVLVTVSPTSSEAHIKRIRDLIPWLADQVKTNEPYTSHYEAWSTKSDDGEVEFLIYFTVESHEKLKARSELAHHKEIARIIREEGVLRKPLKYQVLERESMWSR